MRQIILYYTLFTDEKTELGSDKWLSEGHTLQTVIPLLLEGLCSLPHSPPCSQVLAGVRRCPYVPWACMMSASVTVVALKMHSVLRGCQHAQSSLPRSGSPQSPWQGCLPWPLCINLPLCFLRAPMTWPRLLCLSLANRMSALCLRLLLNPQPLAQG